MIDPENMLPPTAGLRCSTTGSSAPVAKYRSLIWAVGGACAAFVFGLVIHFSSGQSDHYTNSLGMKFMYIEPGTFMMGSPLSESGREWNEAQHEVTLTKGYWMQTTEVTVGQWRKFVNATGYKSEAETSGGALIRTGEYWKMKKGGILIRTGRWEQKAGYYWDNPGFSQSENQPVTCVSWNDSLKFIAWLNQMDDRITYCLPTEAEWENAARAGSAGRYCFGDDESQLYEFPRYGLDSGGSTNSVALQTPNAWGLFDMHGNVYEWCGDWYGDYPSGSATDPAGPSAGIYRVFRGGSWDDSTNCCRSAFRCGAKPDDRGSNVGLRLAAH